MVHILTIVYWLLIVVNIISDGEFEELEVTQLSTPPELPDVMKPQDSGSHTQEQATV